MCRFQHFNTYAPWFTSAAEPHRLQSRLTSPCILNSIVKNFKQNLWVLITYFVLIIVMSEKLDTFRLCLNLLWGYVNLRYWRRWFGIITCSLDPIFSICWKPNHTYRWTLKAFVLRGYLLKLWRNLQYVLRDFTDMWLCM
jgi:hypothetical protein